MAAVLVKPMSHWDISETIYFELKYFLIKFAGMFRTIHAKFVIATVIFVLLSVGIPTAFLVSQFSKNFDQRSRIMLESTLDVVHSSITNAMILGQHENRHIQYIVNNISRNRGVDHVRIISPAGIIDHVIG